MSSSIVLPAKDERISWKKTNSEFVITNRIGLDPPDLTTRQNQRLTRIIEIFGRRGLESPHPPHTLNNYSQNSTKRNSNSATASLKLSSVSTNTSSSYLKSEAAVTVATRRHTANRNFMMMITLNLGGGRNKMCVGE